MEHSRPRELTSLVSLSSVLDPAFREVLQYRHDHFDRLAAGQAPLQSQCLVWVATGGYLDAEPGFAFRFAAFDREFDPGDIPVWLGAEHIAAQWQREEYFAQEALEF